MKALLLSILSLAALPVLPALSGEMRDAPTSAELTERLRASQQADPMKDLQIVDDKDPSEASRPADLMATSEILCYNGLATLVPKGSLLAIPEHLKDRTRFTDGARIVTWQEFFSANRDWLGTSEITLEQASGTQPLGETLVKSLAESRVIQIAVLQQGPISVNPHQPPATTASPQP